MAFDTALDANFYQKGEGVYNAGHSDFGSSSDSDATRIQAAIDAAAADSVPMVLVPDSLLPYDSSAISFNSAVRMVREGNVADVYDLKAYGAAGDGSTDDGAAVDAWLAQGAGDRCFAPAGTYRIPGSHEIASDTVVFGTGETTVFELIDDSQLVRFTVSEIKGGVNDLGAVFQNDQSETRSSGIVVRDFVVDGRSAQLSTTAQTFANIAFVNAERCLVGGVVSRDANKNLTLTDMGNQFRAFCLVFADTEEMMVRGGRYVDAGYENIGARGSAFHTVVDGAHIHKTGDFGRHGIQISDTPRPSHLTVSNCLFTGQSVQVISHDSDDVAIIGNTWRDISASRAINVLDGATRTTITSNIIRLQDANASQGIDCNSDDNTIVKDITITGNTVRARLAPVQIIDAHRVTLSGNVLQTPRFMGVRVRNSTETCEEIVIIGNTIETENATDGDGVLADDVVGLIVNGNTIKAAADGVAGATNTGVRVTSNNIVAVGTAISVGGTDVVSANNIT